MNYTFVLWSGNPEIDNRTIGIIFRDPVFRPVIGQTIMIKRVEYTVMSTTPKGNPDNVAVTYLVERFNANAPYKAPKKFA